MLVNCIINAYELIKFTNQSNLQIRKLKTIMIFLHFMHSIIEKMMSKSSSALPVKTIAWMKKEH